MDFYIQKNSTLPRLKVKFFVSDETNYESFSDLIKTASVTFSMKNLSNNKYVASNSPASIVSKSIGDDIFSNLYEYFIVYEFQLKDTKNTGSYIGEFNITFNNNSCDNLIVPIQQRLYIYVQDSFSN